MNNLELFQQRKNELSSLIDATAEIFRKIKIAAKVKEPSESEKQSTEVKTLSDLKRQLLDNKFKVLVIGEFKRGKSTFINALLHEEILPAYSVPCTAIINEIKYGEEKKAIIYFKKKISQLPEGLADDIKSYINQHKNDAEIPSMTVPFDKLEEYVTITDVEKEQAESVAESPFERAEIYVPLDLCRDGVEIIDSPGLNEHGTRTAVTTRYSQNVDAIIFVLLCQPLASGSELDSIDTLRQAGHKNIFFVCNSFDLIRDKEKPRVIQMAKTRLGERTELGDRGLHFVSSLGALEARTGNKEIDCDKLKEAEEASNFPKMEAALKDFLVNDRGKIKLQTPAETIMQKLTKEIPDIIDKRKKVLKEDTQKLKERYDKLHSETEELRQRVADSMENLRGRISRIEGSIKTAATEFIVNVAEKVPDWINECEPSAKLGRLFTTKSDIDAVTQELVNYATNRIQEDEEEWRNSLMTPMVNSEIEKFRVATEDYIKTFNEKINVADDEFYDEANDKDTDDLQGFFTASGIEATIMTDSLKTVGASAVIGIGMGILGFLNPLLLISAILASGGIARFFNRNAKMEQIKKTVGEEMKRAVQLDVLNKLKPPGTLSEKLNNIVEKVSAALEARIDSVQGNANDALHDSQKGEQEAADTAKLYDELLVRAQQLAGKNQEFIKSLEEQA